jgi:hypothetical protein
MKPLFENWRRFSNKGLLTEKLLLKPGPNGWDLYGELVAQAYERAPTFDPAAAGAFESLGPFVDKMFERIQSRVEIEFVDNDPYINDDHMREEVARWGVLKIFSGGTDHPIFSDELNLKFRAVHDYMAHIQAIGFSGTGFDQKGEIQAYNTHLHTIPRKGIPALFTEVVGQASHFIHRGFFPEQKIAFLEGFDYMNVGEVDPEITGFRLDVENKELIKV